MSVNYLFQKSLYSKKIKEYDFQKVNNQFKEKKNEIKRRATKELKNIFTNNNKNNNISKYDELTINQQNELKLPLTTRHSNLASENSTKSKNNKKFINKKTSDFNKIADNRDIKFLSKVLHNYYIISDENKKNSAINEKDNSNTNKLNSNDLIKYIYKLQKKIKDEENKLFNKSTKDFIKQLDNLISRFSFIIFIFLINNNKDEAKNIFLLMLKENSKYINHIEKKLIEKYYNSRDYPEEIYELLRIYSFIIKYSQFFNLNHSQNVFIGRYSEIVYFIYNLFKYKSNNRLFTLDTKNQINFWYSLYLHYFSYYTIKYYFPMSLRISLNNNIIDIYRTLNENNLTQKEKTLMIKILYNTSLFYYLNGQNDKALINLEEAKDKMFNSDEFVYSIDNMINNNNIINNRARNYSTKKYLTKCKNFKNLSLNNEEKWNRLSTRISTITTSSESFKEKISFNKEYLNKVNDIEKINKTFSNKKINLEDLNALINYGIENGLIDENYNYNSIQTSRSFISQTNNSPSFKLNKKITITKYYKNPLLFKSELLFIEIDLDKNNYISAYNRIIKIFYLLILLKLDKNKEENISFNHEQKIIEKYLNLIIKLTEKKIINIEDKFQSDSSKNSSSISLLSNKEESLNEIYNENSGDKLLNKYKLYLELINEENKDEIKERKILFSFKKEIDYKMLRDIEKFFIFLCRLSLFQITVLNKTQPNNKIKRNDLPILISSQFKDSLSNRQRFDLDNIQTMSLNRCIILKEPDDLITPNNLNIALISEKRKEKYLRKSLKYINKQKEDNYNNIQLRQTNEFKLYQKIIKSGKINKEIKEFINNNFYIVLKVLKKLDNNDIKKIIESPSIIIKPVKLYKKKNKKYLDNKKSNGLINNNLNKFDLSNKNLNYRMSLAAAGLLKTKFKLEKNINLKNNKNNYDYDDFFEIKRKNRKSGQSLIAQFNESKPCKKDTKDYNDNYKDIQLSLDSSINND